MTRIEDRHITSQDWSLPHIGDSMAPSGTHVDCSLVLVWLWELGSMGAWGLGHNTAFNLALISRVLGSLKLHIAHWPNLVMIWNIAKHYTCLLVHIFYVHLQTDRNFTTYLHRHLLGSQFSAGVVFAIHMASTSNYSCINAPTLEAIILKIDC